MSLSLFAGLNAATQRFFQSIQMPTPVQRPQLAFAGTGKSQFIMSPHKPNFFDSLVVEARRPRRHDEERRFEKMNGGMGRNRSGNNRVQNKQIKAAYREAGRILGRNITPGEKRAFHMDQEKNHEHDMGYSQLVSAIIAFLGGAILLFAAMDFSSTIGGM